MASKRCRPKLRKGLMIQKVIVRKRKVNYLCRFDPAGWRCGQCLFGIVRAKRLSKCRRCGATVTVVV